mmetsp:Transcript_71401/g.127371  ORF Transcript_71401/g.127371 Transcript_71401/m.127371 type:complete len:259 (-) Transcript_71401:202-978(-)
MLQLTLLVVVVVVVFHLSAWLVVTEAGHGSFPGSVVRVKGDPVLRAVAEPVTQEELRCQTSAPKDAVIVGGCGAPAESWVSLMLQGLQETHGACIAAPQVGISERLIIMSIPSERIREEKLEAGSSTVSPPIVMVNPAFWPLPDAEMLDVWETCLSIPGERVVVQRHAAIAYRAQRLDGVIVQGKASGRFALTLQHEVDHLDGILMTDKSVEPVGKPRADGLGSVTSTNHWALMNATGYSLRTFMPPGAAAVREKEEL